MFISIFIALSSNIDYWASLESRLKPQGPPLLKTRYFVKTLSVHPFLFFNKIKWKYDEHKSQFLQEANELFESGMGGIGSYIYGG